MEIREFLIKDYGAVVELWESVEGVGLHDDVDSQHGIGIYLFRNPGLSFVAVDENRVVGAVHCGHDGRRGYLHHLAVAESYRNRGVGKNLVQTAINALRVKGFRRCNSFVFCDNINGLNFWKGQGWSERNDLKVIYKDITI